MAQSLAHKFGQIIGEVLEAAATPLLEEFAVRTGLYLDKKGSRPCRSGRKCSWRDGNGNLHDLDFVLERGGSPDELGRPAAFIETAWRRYSKHSRNKVQEIQGAIEPLAHLHGKSSPFKGAILAGVFTAGSLTQLRSLGFRVLYFSYDSVVAVFQRFRIDAHFGEDTTEEEFQAKIHAFQRMTRRRRSELAAALIESHRAEVDAFMQELEAAVSRSIERIVVLALHGAAVEMTAVDEAVRFIERYRESAAKAVERYEIQVRYNNGDNLVGCFKNKADAIEFLNAHAK